jgi:hypothetical protein
LRIEHPRVAALLAVGTCLVLLIGVEVGAAAGGSTTTARRPGTVTVTVSYTLTAVPPSRQLTPEYNRPWASQVASVEATLRRAPGAVAKAGRRRPEVEVALAGRGVRKMTSRVECD